MSCDDVVWCFGFTDACAICVLGAVISWQLAIQKCQDGAAKLCHYGGLYTDLGIYICHLGALQ